MSDNILKLNRRQFLKTTAVAGAVVAMGDKLFGGPVSGLVENTAAAPVQEDVWIPTACKHCGTGLGQGCGILAHRVNGVVIGIKGNPNDPSTQGKLCLRAHAAVHNLYNAYRVKTPLKRTNPVKAAYNPKTERWEGTDPGWVEISWDEALNTVAEKLKAVKATNPNGFIHMSGHGIGIETPNFSKPFGSVNNISGGGGMICAAARHTIAYIFNGTSGMGSADETYTQYQVLWGRSIGVNKAATQDVYIRWTQPTERGNRFVIIDPRCSEEASKAYWWIQIKGGTDGAMGRAVVNVMLHELNKFDVEFIKEWSNGPYLIGPDGLYVRSKTDTMKDASRNATLGKPLVWDPDAKAAKSFDDKTIKDFAIEGTYTVDGVQCQPAFQLLKDHYKPFTPEWASQICDVPPETIRRFAAEYVEAAQIGSTITIDGKVLPYRPASIECGRGWQSARHGFVDCHVYAHLNALVGNPDVPGGLLGASKTSLKPDGDGVVKPGGDVTYSFKWPPHYRSMDDYFPTAYKAFWDTWKRVLDPQKYGMTYKAEVLGMYGAGPTQTMASLDEVVQGIAKMPFSYAYGYHFDQQTELADIVFPDPGWTGKQHFVGPQFRQPLLAEPQFQTRWPEQVELDLAERVGILPAMLKAIGPTDGPYALDVNKKYTWEEIEDRNFKNDYGEQHGLAWFKQNGIAPEGEPQPGYAKYGRANFPKRTTRYPIYFEYILWAGRQLKADLDKLGRTHPDPEAYVDFIPLPDWLPSPILSAPAEFDLIATNWKSNTHTMGFTQDNPFLMEIAALQDPYLTVVWMNRKTGEQKGFKDGDIVYVESYNSGKRQKGPVKLSEVVHPKTVMFGMTANSWSKHINPDAQLGMIYNQLISSDYKWIDPVAGGIEVHSAVKVYKA